MATGIGGTVTLRSTFERFYNTLDATTVPADGGGRMVIGVPHAVALSEATDALYHALAAANLRLSSQHGRALSAYPPGIVVEESDSPEGPWTPIPAGEVRIETMGIGGNGADAVLMAALDSANKVAAFPIDKWNAMQAARPGANHQRFHAGEVVSEADLAVLESAAKLLRMKAPPKPLEDTRFLSASSFGKSMAARLRMAASPKRKGKRVATIEIDGVVCYSVADAKRWWPRDVPKDL